MAGSYCAILALAVPAELAFVYAMRFFQAMDEGSKCDHFGDRQTNILNVFANYIFIYRDLGVIGSAWASCLSTYGMCFILLWRLRHEVRTFCARYYTFSSDGCIESGNWVGRLDCSFLWKCGALYCRCCSPAG